MPDVRLKTRIQNKYKTLDEWNSLVKGEFTPLKGEICYAYVDDNVVYQKIGNGETDFVDLPWLNNVGINTVDNFKQLSTTPKADDIAFVENSTFIETITKVELNPFKMVDIEQILPIHITKEPKFLSEIDWNSINPDWAGNDYGYYIETALDTEEDGEFFVIGASYSDRMAQAWMDLDSGYSFYYIITDNGYWIRLKDCSIKQFMNGEMGADLNEEQLQFLFNNYYADIDNPSFDWGWLHLAFSSEPLTDNSLNLDGMYITLSVNADPSDFMMNMAMTAIWASIVDDPNADEGVLSIGYDFYEDDIDDPIIIYNVANAFLSEILNFGEETETYDLYGGKGFYQFDNEWTSLEEKMNLPKVVNTYNDLPETFIENGICGVKQDSKESGPLIDEIGLDEYSTWYIDVSVSADAIKQSIRDYLEMVEDDPYVEFYADYETSDGKYGTLYFEGYGNDGGKFGEISFREPILTFENVTYREYFYVPEDGLEISLPSMRNTGESVDMVCDRGWYSVLFYDNGKTVYTQERARKEENDFCPFGSTAVRFVNIEYYPTDTESIQFETFKIACLSFNSPENFKEHSKGFYKFNDGRWTYENSINSISFDNENVLKQITEEDLGDVVLNTDARHTHNNRVILDQLTKEHLEKIDRPQQLVEGLIEDGYSANKYSIPTGASAWIEGQAAPIMAIDEDIKQSAALNVTTTTSGKSTITTVLINIVFNNNDQAQKIYTAVTQPAHTFTPDYSYAEIIFADEPDKLYLIKFSNSGHTISDNVVNLKFTLVDGKEQFPITGTIYRNINSLYLIPNTGIASHSEGGDTIATAPYSHAEGLGTRTTLYGSNVRGWYNEIDYEVGYLDVVGNGTGENNRSNAYTLDTEGNVWFAGGIMSDIGVEVPYVAAETINAGELTSETLNAANAEIETLNATNVESNTINATNQIRANSIVGYESIGAPLIGSTVFNLNMPILEHREYPATEICRLTATNGTSYSDLGFDIEKDKWYRVTIHNNTYILQCIGNVETEMLRLGDSITHGFSIQRNGRTNDNQNFSIHASHWGYEFVIESLSNLPMSLSGYLASLQQRIIDLEAKLAAIEA